MTYGNYPDLTAVRKILIIKLRHLGDVLLTSPVFSYLKSRLPEAEIHAYIYKDGEEMLSGHPAIQRFLFCERSSSKGSKWKRIWRELKLLWQIRQEKYDLVINLTEGDRGALAALVSGSKIAVGFDPERQGFIGKKRAYTHIVKNCKTPRHAVERNFDALRKIGLFPKQSERALYFHVPLEAKVTAHSFCARKGFDRPFVVINPVSRWRFKCPTPEKMAELISAFQTRFDESVLLTSGPSEIEKQWLMRIYSLVENQEKIRLLNETLSIKEFAALLQQSRGLITVDSMALHLASALQIPCVALFGPTSDENWGPWMNDKARVVSEGLSCRPCGLDGCGGGKRSDCLEQLSTEKILSAYEEVTHSTKISLLH